MQRSKYQSQSKYRLGRCCLHCGKNCHVNTECWRSPKNQSGSGRGQHGGCKEKPKIGTGKGAGDQAAAADQLPQMALVSSLDLARFEELGRLPNCDAEGWLRWTHDTGAAHSTFPLDAKRWARERRRNSLVVMMRMLFLFAFHLQLLLPPLGGSRKTLPTQQKCSSKHAGTVAFPLPSHFCHT